jgi:hypothetical protein
MSFNEILGYVCLECVTQSILCYLAWENISVSASSNMNRALTVIVTGMASKPLWGMVSKLF